MDADPMSAMTMRTAPWANAWLATMVENFVITKS
jgi:hypothetical protein